MVVSCPDSKVRPFKVNLGTLSDFWRGKIDELEFEILSKSCKVGFSYIFG